MRNKNYTALMMLALAGVSALVYFPTFSNGWVWDDVSSVLLHKHVQAPARLWYGLPDPEAKPKGIAEAVAQLFREDQHAFGRGQGNFYRPLLSLTFAWDFFWSVDASYLRQAPKDLRDLPPTLFHASSTLWHAAAACALLLLLRSLRASRFVCGAAAMLFVVHPLHTEAVTYISGRADMMAAFFIWTAWLLSPSEISRRNWPRVVAACLLFSCGLLSKESAMILPGLALAGVLIQPARKAAPWWRRLAPSVCLLAVLGVYLALRMTVLRFGAGGGTAAAPLWTRLTETGQAFFGYLGLLFVPTQLHMERTLSGVPGWHGLAGWAVLAALIALAVAAHRAGRWRLTLGMAWFLLAWLPISGIFPLNAPMAEHWLYVPMGGFWLAMLEGLNWVLKARGIQRGLGLLRTAPVCGLCLVFVCLAVQRNEDWKNNERLFRATLAENPDSLRVNFNLAVAYEEMQRDWPSARRWYERAATLYAKNRRGQEGLSEAQMDVALSLGNMWLRQGNFARAMEYYGTVLRYKPTAETAAYSASASLGMGRAMLATGEVKTAYACLRRAAAMNPGLADEVRRLYEGGPLFP